MIGRPSRTKPRPAPAGTFVALDFETATRSRDSACAVALVRVEAGKVTAREHRLIRPPSEEFEFSWLHGITWEHVRGEPSFADVWRAVAPILDGAEYIAAHNAVFDRSVLATCCERSGIVPPDLPYVCTVRLARDALGIYPTTLDRVCRELKVPLRHHEALSDAEACAAIVLRAHRRGARVLAR